MLRALAILICCMSSWPAKAMVGDARPADPAIARHVVLIVGSLGSFCTGVAVARDLVLTAAHCVLPGAVFKLVVFDAQHRSTFTDITDVQRHPMFDNRVLLSEHATADVALLKLAAPLPSTFAAAPLAALRKPVAVGDRFLVAGYGVSVPGDGKTGGTIRAAVLVATGKPGTLQIRLVDPATNDRQPGRGACDGDSGAPVFDLAGARPAVIGVVSWVTGPNLDEGCGGLTGVTPLGRYKDWLVAQAARMGSPIVP